MVAAPPPVRGSIRNLAVPYLRNAWYPASWSHDVGDQPLARTVLQEPVVLFRGEGGEPRALYDACPHRFAPLSQGRLKQGIIACGYHGLEFDGTGRCVRNPHGKGIIPRALGVRSFCVTERYGMIWIWMGDAEAADASLLPAFPQLEDPAFKWVHGHLHVSANYELVIDNLLDLTHVEFLHPFLASPGNSERTNFRAEQRGDEVSAYYDVQNEPITGLFRLLWEGEEEFANLIAYMHWQAPTHLMLENGMSTSDRVAENDPRIPVVHLLAPIDEDTTLYFWAAGRNRAHANDQVSDILRFGIQTAFENEDEPMIKAVRSRMRSNDLLAHKPALLPIDEAAVRARRILAKKIEQESLARSAVA